MDVRLILLVALFSNVALATTCYTPTKSNFTLTSNFEPSDMIWDAARQRLWVVSDDGVLASFTHEGKLVTYNKIRQRPDLEGIVRILGREQFLYLQSEDTRKLLEFNVQSGQIVREFQLHGTGHFESVTWVYGNSTAGVLYSGVQANGLIYVHQLNFEERKAVLIDSFKLPSPNPGDLSALHYSVNYEQDLEYLAALFDRHRTMVLYTRNIGSQSLLEWKAIKTWNLPFVGAEGFAWASVDGMDYFFLGIDTATKTVPKVKAIHRFNLEEIDSCFDVTSVKL